MKLGVIGGGAFGTALASLGARAGRDVRLWARNPQVVQDINRHHKNDLYLPEVALPAQLQATSDVSDMAWADALLLVCPAQYMRDVAKNLRPHIAVDRPLIICAKGIERNTGMFMSQVLDEVMASNPLAVLSGPNLAREVAQGLPAAFTIACADEDLGDVLVDALGTPSFRPYYSPDVIGAQIGGAMKNVLAIAAGVVLGLGLGENARAALITRGLTEMTRFGLALGARRETLTGLSGMGDLLLTCVSEQSRNMTFGKALGEGKTMDDILAERRSVAEGVWTAHVLGDLGKKAGVEMPIVEAVCTVLDGDADARDVVQKLLSRPFRHEEI